MATTLIALLILVNIALLADRNRWKKKATVDRLTGCFTRSAGVKIGPGRDLLFVDLDGLKAINDTLGHSAGDAYLKKAGAVLRRYGRVIRWGGDEFVVACRKALTPEIHGALLAEGVKASIGSVPLLKGDSLTEAITRADKEMYL